MSCAGLTVTQTRDRGVPLLLIPLQRAGQEKQLGVLRPVNQEARRRDYVSQFGLAVRRQAAKQRDLVRIRFGSPSSSKFEVCGHTACDFVPHN